MAPGDDVIEFVKRVPVRQPGFALLIVPGIFALRSYRRWQDGSASEPRAAWSVLALAIGVVAGAFVWQRSTPLAVLVALIITVVGVSLSSP